MNVVITGGRHFKDRKMMWETLNKIHQETPIERLAHGACTGADNLAREWAIENGLTAVGYPADWHIGKKAGPMRNAYMLQQEQPDLVVAFPGGRGTQNAIDFAKKMGYTITIINENGSMESKETL
jgi:hypothetical protein